MKLNQRSLKLLLFLFGLLALTTGCTKSGFFASSSQESLSIDSASEKLRRRTRTTTTTTTSTTLAPMPAPAPVPQKYSFYIGDTNVESLPDSSNGNLLVAQAATLNQSGTLQSLSFYITNAAGFLRLGVYDSSGPGGGPGNKLAETNDIIPVIGWNTSNVISPITLNAGTYWLAYFASDNNLTFVIDRSGSGSARYYSLGYGAMPNSFSTSPTVDPVQWSLYASLSTSPALAPNPIPAQTPTPTPTTMPAPAMTPAPAVVPTNTGGVPTPQGIAGKPIVGRIDAYSGQVIENVHVTTTSGPCIVVQGGVNNVIIRNAEIGPCGSQEGTMHNEGIFITSGSHHVTIQGNVIHDVSTGLFAVDALHPIIFDRNFIYNIRGPLWQGQIVQFNNMRGGTGSSKITCNIKDGLYGPSPVIGTRSNEDHISMYNSEGSQAYPIEIAFNRIRGNQFGGSESGSGMMLGDSPAGGGGTGSAPSGWYWVHDNTIVYTNNVGIGVAGGHDITIENNRIDNRGPNQASMTGWPYTIRKFDATASCGPVNYRNNRGIGYLWSYNHDGSLAGSLLDMGGCSYVTDGNNFNDSSLYPAMFDEPYSQCN